MSSYSEYLSRKMQKTQKFVDTRPHRDAGHQTEIVKRLAASAVQENVVTCGVPKYGSGRTYNSDKLALQAEPQRKGCFSVYSVYCRTGCCANFDSCKYEGLSDFGGVLFVDGHA
jgi:hypothetical protein